MPILDLRKSIAPTRQRTDIQIFGLEPSVVEPEPPRAALFGRSREKGAAPAPALQLKLQLWPYV